MVDTPEATWVLYLFSNLLRVEWSRVQELLFDMMAVVG